MKRLLQASLLILLANSAWAFSTTLRMGLLAPATGQLDYPTQFDTMFRIIDSSSAIQAQPNTFTSSNTFTGPGSTVTVNQSLNLPYIGNGQCLSQNNGVVGVSCGGGGTSTLGVFNGTSGAPGVAVSSPTGGLNVDSNTMLVTLQGPSTAFVTIKPSSVTLQGNTFNGNSQLVQTDGTGHIPTAVIGTGVILSTGALQSGATFYTSSGTAVNMNSSTNTVQTLLQVNGIGLSGSQVVGQIAGAALNVTAAGNVGLGTAIPGFALDEQQGTANFAFGLKSSTATISTATISGQIVFKDGTSQNTAPVAGAANLGVSSGSATSSVIVTSPTVNVDFDSTTFKVSLQGSATSFVSVNFKGGGLTNTVLATDANGVVISTTVSGGGGSGNVTFSTAPVDSLAYYSPSTSTVKGANVTTDGNSLTTTDLNATGAVVADTYRSKTAGFTFINFSNSVTGYQFKDTQALPFTVLDLDTNNHRVGVNNKLPQVDLDVTGQVQASSTITITAVTNQMFFGSSTGTILSVPIPTSTRTVTLPDAGANSSIVLTTGAQTLNGLTTFTSSNTVVSTMTLSNPALVNTILATNANGVIVSTTITSITSGSAFTASTITFSPTTVGILGTTTNDSANVGIVGQTVSNPYTGQSITNGQWGDGTSITLTAGDWLVTHTAIVSDGATTAGQWQCGVSQTSGNSATGLSPGDNEIYSNAVALVNTGCAVADYRVSLSGSATIYAKLNNSTSGTNPTFYGRISAVRIR